MPNSLSPALAFWIPGRSHHESAFKLTFANHSQNHHQILSSSKVMLQAVASVRDAAVTVGGSKSITGGEC
eukprot:2045285-Rhodomonas_salina.1